MKQPSNIQAADEIKLLEDFITNNHELELLESIIDKFNIFRSLGIINTEIRHSHFLSWLLDPNETHGLDAYFLKIFLKEIAANNKTFLSGYNIFQINAWNLDNTLVLREWNNIDILIVNEENKFVCVIENKVDSREHSNQLTRYREIIEEHYKDYHKMFLYLTVNGERPEKEEVYISLSYEQIALVISRLLKSKESQLSSEILIFINHYLEMIKRFIMEKSDVQEICKQIYQKHQKAIDLINQYKPNLSSEISEALLETLRANENVIIDHFSNTFVKFITKDLDFVPAKGDGWTRSKKILLFEIQINEKAVSLVLYIGPGDPEIRKTIYNCILQTPIKGTTTQLYSKWTSIYKTELKKSKELEGKSREEIKEILKMALDKYFNGDHHLVYNSLKNLKGTFDSALWTETPTEISVSSRPF